MPRVLPQAIGGAIVVAALYFGQELLVPLALAGLLAFVLAPACAALERALPRTAAVAVVVVLAFSAIAALGAVVVGQASSLAQGLPAYKAVMLDKWEALTHGPGLLARLLGGIAPGAAGETPDGAATLALARRFAQPLLGPLATAGVVLIFTVFILLYNEDLRDRLVRLVGRHDLHRTILAMNDAARRLSRYFLFQLLLNTSFGVLIAVSLALAGLPGAILWGIVAALMRFVPFIGSFVALAPPLLLALAVSPGYSLAIVVLALFLCIELVMSQVVEPLIYGHSTGLSPIAIIVATAFWAELWGPIGLLLATPLTVCLVVVGRHVEGLAFFDVLLGATSPLSPAETFYQRALEGKTAVMLANARQHIGATSLTDYYDHVALPGLALAQRDRARDSLAFERLESVHGQVETLLASLAHEAPPAGPGTAPANPPEEWSRDGAVICINGRGQLDGLAAGMAVQALGLAGFGARHESNLVLGSAGDPDPGLAEARLCCLSVLEEGSGVSAIRYFVRRMQKAMPSAQIVVALWHADGASPLLAALRAEGQDEHIVLSIGELVAFAQAVSMQRKPALA